MLRYKIKQYQKAREGRKIKGIYLEKHKGDAVMQEVERKLYPLTVAQKLHFYTLKCCPKKQVLNIGTSMLIKEDIDFDLLREAIYRCYDRCEALRIRFTEEKEGMVYQYIVPRETREIELMDFSHYTEEAVDEILRKWTESPFDRVDSPLNKMVMINTPNGYKGVYFLVDHMTMDSYSIITLMTDLIEIYCSLKYDMEYPKAMQSYIKALEKDLAYEKDSPQRKKDALYWHKIYEGSEPIFTDVLGTGKLEQTRKETNNPTLRAARIVSKDVSAAHKVFHLEPQPTKELLEYCEVHQIPMVCLLMMGLRTYLSKMNKNEKDVSIKTTISRRATVLDKKSGGTRIHFFPCRTVVEDEQTFMEGMKVIQQKQNEIFKHANYDPIALISECREMYGYEPGLTHECMSLTYQPLSMRSKDERLKDIDYKCKWYSNGVAGCPLYLTVMHNSEDGGLDFYFEYQTGVITEQQLEYMYYYLCKIIFMGIEHEAMTVGEILRTV